MKYMSTDQPFGRSSRCWRIECSLKCGPPLRSGGAARGNETPTRVLTSPPKTLPSSTHDCYTSVARVRQQLLSAVNNEYILDTRFHPSSHATSNSRPRDASLCRPSSRSSHSRDLQPSAQMDAEGARCEERRKQSECRLSPG
jgi:hypothetical protein